MNCSICHRELTDPRSIEREIGPVCYAAVKRLEKRQERLPDEISLTAEMGPEISGLLERTGGRSFGCFCGNEVSAAEWHGYPHADGLQDSSWKRWWAFVVCGKCKYQWSWPKSSAG